MEGKREINEDGVPVKVKPGPKVVESTLETSELPADPEVPDGSVNVRPTPIGQDKNDTAKRQTVN